MDCEHTATDCGACHLCLDAEIVGLEAEVERLRAELLTEQARRKGTIEAIPTIVAKSVEGWRTLAMNLYPLGCSRVDTFEQPPCGDCAHCRFDSAVRALLGAT
jgi:hypothetical protein